MNKERLLQLAEVLESENAEKHFDMRNYFRMKTYRLPKIEEPARDFINNCGASACIAGWAVVLFDPEYKGDEQVGSHAAQLLDLSFFDQSDLFVPHGAIEDEYGEVILEPMRATPKQAAKVVRHFVETGDVDWSAALKD